MRIFYVKTVQNFTLIPFEKNSQPIELRGAIVKRGGIVSLWFNLSDPLGQVVYKQYPASRRDLLWQDTCFEMFLGPKGFEHYWEVNINPYGAWNMYAFSSYREGMQEEKKMQDISLAWYKDETFQTLNVHLDVGGVMGKQTPLELGVSAVIVTKSGGKEYWALAHSQKQPDFHHRSTMCLEI